MIDQDQNSKILSELGFLERPNIKVKKRTIPKPSLLKDLDTLNPRVKMRICQWFEEYSDCGKMDPPLCAGLFSSMISGVCHANDSRVQDIFLKYDTDKDQYLTLDTFLQLYLEASQNMPQVVWSNLNALNIRNDLRDAEEIKNEKVDITTLVRYIISSNKDYSQLLFSLLVSEDLIAKEALRIVNRLPTDPKIFSDIVLLKGIRDVEEAEKRDWNRLLGLNSRHKLLYNLQIVEYLIEQSEITTAGNETKKADELESLWLQDPRLLVHKKSWKNDFLAYGGLDQLSRALSMIQGEISTKPTSLEEAISLMKKCLPTDLKQQ